MKKKKQTRRKMRDRLGALVDPVYLQIYNWAPRERAAALRALAKLTQTNCGATLYNSRALLRTFVEWATSEAEKKAHRREGL
jgi:hypothetical protein